MAEKNYYPSLRKKYVPLSSVKSIIDDDIHLGYVSMEDLKKLAEDDLKKIKIGRWERDIDAIKCSQCGFGMFQTGYYFQDGRCICCNTGKFKPDFCPGCGAEMRESEG